MGGQRVQAAPAGRVAAALPPGAGRRPLPHPFAHHGPGRLRQRGRHLRRPDPPGDHAHPAAPATTHSSYTEKAGTCFVFIAKTSARLVCLFVCSFFRRRPTSFCTLRRATSRRCCTVAGRAPASSRKSATASSRRPIAAIRYAPAATPTWPRPLPDAEAADRRQVGRFQPTKVQHPLEIQGTHNGHSIRPSKSP